MSSSMEEFEVTVHTSPDPTSGTYSHLRLKLIGSEGETVPITVNEVEPLLPGSVRVVRVRSDGPVGRIILVRLRLEVSLGLPDLDWHCSRVEVRRLGYGKEEEEGVEDRDGVGPRSSGGQVFVCERWLRRVDGDVELRSAMLCLLASEVEERLRLNRVKELQHKQQTFRWRTFVEGAPHCLDISNLRELGPNLSHNRKSPGINLQYLHGFADRAEPWKSFRELEAVLSLNGHQNAIARFVQAHWSEDWFFGYQCLNGCNPLQLCRTHLLPPHLSVTADMLCPFLPNGSSLEQELEKGNFYLLDYEVLDGVPANVVNGKQTYLSAPLCLLHLNQHGQLLPVAIQLQQRPGPQNPVFLPSDHACDWLLAKLWVHSADFQVHQLISHFLRTHMLGELCCTATLRQLPEVHPLHQLLMPHIRSTLQINLQARASLLAPKGIFDKAIGCGLKALPVLLSRAATRLHYRSLCVPDDLVDRGVDTLPECYYAKDALRVWDALHKFVGQWVNMCYHGDSDVLQDPELQNWISDINTHGFLPNSGMPQSFSSKSELSKFVTMVIFTCSALHAAVNFSQLDFDLWMPNCPFSMLRVPPQAKDTVTHEDILSYLPDVSSTCSVLYTLTLLSQPASDYVPLCHYREAVFRSGAPRRLVEHVQAELQAISDDITTRNSKMDLPYPYLSPKRIENSVAI